MGNRESSFEILGPIILSANFNPAILASYGFYYTGQRHEIKCFACEIVMDIEQASVQAEHRQRSPQCIMVQMPAEEEMGLLAQIQALEPAYEFMMNRFNSYENFNFPWPEDLSPAILANNGFYYTGEGCVVKCFSCEITMDIEEEFIDPVLEHRERSPQCIMVQPIASASRPPSPDTNISARR